VKETEKSCKVEMIDLEKEEKNYYVCLQKNSKTKFDKLLELDESEKNYLQAYALTGLRSACDHLFLIYSKFKIRDSDCMTEKIEDFFGAHYENNNDENTSKTESVGDGKSHTIVAREMVNETVEKLDQGNIVHCPLCLNDLKNAVVTICGHIFCNVCEKNSILDSSMCPACSTILTRKDCLYIPRFLE